MSTRPAEPRWSGSSAPSPTIQRRPWGDGNDTAQRRRSPSRTYSCTLSPVCWHSSASRGRATARRSGTSRWPRAPRATRPRPRQNRPAWSRRNRPCRSRATASRCSVARGSPVIACRSTSVCGPLPFDRVEHANRLVKHADVRYAFHLPGTVSQHVERLSKPPPLMSAATLPSKIWDRHVVRAGATGEPDLLYIDLHLVHEVTSPQAFEGLRLSGRRVRRPELTVATEDHNVPTTDIDRPIADEVSAQAGRRAAPQHRRVRHHPLPDGRRRPGHRPRHRPRAGPHAAGHDDRLRRQPHVDPRGVRCPRLRHRHERGRARAGHADAAAGPADAGWRSTSTAHCPPASRRRTSCWRSSARSAPAAGSATSSSTAAQAFRSLSMEGRMTVCNMSIEAGAKAGLVAPDDTTFAYLEGRAHAPTGAAWERALDDWRTLRHRRRRGVGPRGHPRRHGAAPVRHVGHQSRPGRARSTAPCPRPTTTPTPRRARASPGRSTTWASAPGRRSATSPSTRCSSARARTAGSRTCGPPPAVLDGRHVTAKRVLVVPGSHAVKAQAEAEGLDRIFTAAGADWRQPGCSMCLAMNPDKLRSRRAVGEHEQPQLRGSPGPRRAHPPRLPRRRRRHRRRRPLRHPGGPVMKPVRVITGTALPLRRADVDTDQIIPAEWLKRIERTGYEKGLFATWRDDRDFVLNDERFTGASILVAGPAFGVGSSREHAVWALQQYGFDAVIAPSFSDIFHNNCTKNGLVPVVVRRGRRRAALGRDRGRPGNDDRRRRRAARRRGAEHRPRRAVRPRPVDPAPLPRRSRRHRHHARPRGRHHRLRGDARRLARLAPDIWGRSVSVALVAKIRVSV